MTTSKSKAKPKAPAKRARRSTLPAMGAGAKLGAFTASKVDTTAEPETAPEPSQEIIATVKVPPPETPEPTKAMTLRLTLPAWRQLKFMAIEAGCPAHTLMIDAVNDLFVKHGKLPIA